MKKDEVGLTILVTGVIVPLVASFANYASEVIIDALERKRISKLKKKKAKQNVTAKQK